MQMSTHCAANCWAGPGAYEVHMHSTVVVAMDKIIRILDVFATSAYALLEVSAHHSCTVSFWKHTL